MEVGMDARSAQISLHLKATHLPIELATSPWLSGRTTSLKATSL